MLRLLTIPLAILILPAVWACSSEPTTSTTPSAEVMNDDPEIPPARDTVPAVMQAKLVHAQAILEAIVLSDFSQAESNALALKRISQGGDWLVHDSATYFDFSEEFRGICDDLANHSRAQNVKAMVTDYAYLTNTCVACHDYLQYERRTKDVPGRVSMLGGTVLASD